MGKLWERHVESSEGGTWIRYMEGNKLIEDEDLLHCDHINYPNCDMFGCVECDDDEIEEE